jgi:hypothetical protein
MDVSQNLAESVTIEYGRLFGYGAVAAVGNGNSFW